MQNIKRLLSSMQVSAKQAGLGLAALTLTSVFSIATSVAYAAPSPKLIQPPPGYTQCSTTVSRQVAGPGTFTHVSAFGELGYSLSVWLYGLFDYYNGVFCYREYVSATDQIAQTGGTCYVIGVHANWSVNGSTVPGSSASLTKCADGTYNISSSVFSVQLSGGERAETTVNVSGAFADTNYWFSS